MHKPIDVFNNPENYIDFLCDPNLERLHGQYFDWKEIPNPYNKDKAREKVTNPIIECISAFANCNIDGGLIILGIANNGIVKGTEHLNEEQINAIMSMPNQQLINHTTQSKTISINAHIVRLIYVAYEYRNICHTNESNPKAWKREGAQNLPFKREDWDYFRYRKNPGLWEMQPCSLYEERLLDKALYEEFKQGWLADSETASGYDIIDVLENAGAIVKHQNEWWFTNAGYLFFCANPQRLFPSAYIRFLKYKPTKFSENPNPGATTNEKEFSGALPTMIRKIRDWVRDSGWFERYTYRAKDGFSFVHEDEYPLIAIGEAIVNAVVHRDYALQMSINCLSFEDTFIVRNPGGILQNQLSVPHKFALGEDIVLRSYARNQKLIEWFRKMPDEEGKPFVRRLSEGTKRIQTEMQKLDLPAPEYHTNGETILILKNNIEERRKRFFSHDAPTRSSGEYINLFEIKITGTDTTQYDKDILQKELLGVLKDNLQNNQWYIDKFSKGRLLLHQQGKSVTLDNPFAEKICRIFQAYILQVKMFGSQFYLCIDYKAILKNIQTLDKFSNELKEDILGQRAIVKYQNKWENCTIRKIESQTSTVHLTDYDTEVQIENANVIPELYIAQIEKCLIDNKISFDLHAKLKEASLSTLQNASIERAKLTLSAAKSIAQVMPLRLNGFQFTVQTEPEFLFSAPEVVSDDTVITPLTVFHDIQEPQVSFSQNQHSTNILEGLNKYGSWKNEPRDITIIPVCTIAERQQMIDLISRLQQGKYKYEGSERTFGVKFLYETIYTVSTHQEIEAECKRLVQQHSNWEGDNNLSRIFLISIPENLFAIDDVNSPYYGIKEFLLEKGIPCQMINTPTLQNPDWKDLNLTLNIVAKCGLVPWVLSERLSEADFFMGIAYTTTRNSRNREKMMGFASVFDEYGRWRFYKGESVFTFDKKKEYFARLVPETLKELGNLPDNAKIHIHSASRFSKEDAKTIINAAKSVLPNATFSFVWINDTHIMRVYDNSNVGGSLSRGGYIYMSPKRFLLSTTGYNIFKRSLGTPRMIEANLFYVEDQEKINVRMYAKQLLALTKLNWASTNALTGEPITTKYAQNIAYLAEKFIQRRGVFHLHKALERTPWFI